MYLRVQFICCVGTMSYGRMWVNRGDSIVRRQLPPPQHLAPPPAPPAPPATPCMQIYVSDATSGRFINRWSDWSRIDAFTDHLRVTRPPSWRYYGQFSTFRYNRTKVIIYLIIGIPKYTYCFDFSVSCGVGIWVNLTLLIVDLWR